MLVFDNSADLISLDSQTLPYTFCGWAKLNTDTNNRASLCMADNNVDWNGLGINTDGTTLIGYTTTTTVGVNGSVALTLGNYFFWAITRNNTDNFFTWYYSDLGSNTFVSITELGTLAVNGFSVKIGNNDGLFFFSGAVGIIKKFNRQLFANDLAIEKESILPRSSGCVGWWPTFHTNTIADAVIDYSGNGANWTIGGTLTSEENPPIPWGTTWFPGSFEGGSASPTFTNTNTSRGNFLVF